ncbi:la-related protein 6-like [Pleurodeles waltl]
MSSVESLPLRLSSHKSVCSTPVQVQTRLYYGTDSHQVHHYGERNLPSFHLTQDSHFSSFDGSFCDLSETFDEDSLEIDCGLPDSNLIKRIIAQVEFYLSDENLARDAFLLKHVQKNKMGFVSIKLLTSFKKVKYLTRDWRTTLYAINFSDNLEVNEEGTKVRRKSPVPESLLGIAPTKLLLAWDFGPPVVAPNNFVQNNSIEIVTKMFSPYGAIVSIRVLKPGKEVPSHVKKYLSKYPELNTKSCALIEYENLESAKKAYEELSRNQGLSNGDSTKVVLLNERGVRKKNGEDKEELEDIGFVDKKTTKKQSRVADKLQNAIEDLSLYSSSESDSAPASPVFTSRCLSASAFTNGVVCSPAIFKPVSFSSPRSSPLLTRKLFAHSHYPSPLAVEQANGGCFNYGTSPEIRKFTDYSSDSGISSGSPWVKQRKAAAYSKLMENKQMPFKPSVGTSSSFLPSGVIRLPYGPDGSKGFYNSIGRGKLVLRH